MGVPKEGEKDQGWLVAEYGIGIGNGAINGDPVVIVTLKALDLENPGTFIFFPQMARDIAKYLVVAADELERKPDGTAQG